MKKKFIALLMSTLVITTVFLGCGENKKQSENTNISNTVSTSNETDELVNDITVSTSESGLKFETVKLEKIKAAGFNNVKEDLNYQKVCKDFNFKGPVNIYRIDFVAGDKAVVTNTGSGGESIAIDFKDVVKPIQGQFISLGINDKGEIFVTGEVTEEEPHLSNNN